MKPGQIRPIVICVFLDGDRIFVAEYHNPSTGKPFYRPLGGAIAFGEHSRACLAREIREELGAEVKDLTYLGMLENIFTYDGQPNHEIVLVYRANLADPRLYQVEAVHCREDNGSEFITRWKPLAEFRTGKAPLYPEGLLDLLGRASV